MLSAALGTLFWWAVFWLVFRRDRRRVRNGVLFLIAAHSSLGLLVRVVETTLPLGSLLVLAGTGLLLIGVLVLAGYLIANGLTMLRKEGRTLGNALAGLGGVALLAAPVVSAASIATLHPVGLGLGTLLALLSLHLGLAFLVFLSASVLYLLFPRPLQPTAVIVHGAGLIRGKVTPLLRGRLDRAVGVRAELLAQGLDPLLVPSGGKGADEPRSEGEAMAEYLVEEAGVPADRVLAETESATTEENLTFSHRLLEKAGHQGPYLVVTSRYHAFRAALLARRLGYADEAVGGRTAWYYVPSATLREFIAVMSYRKWWNAVLLLPSLVLVAAIVRGALLQA